MKVRFMRGWLVSFVIVFVSGTEFTGADLTGAYFFQADLTEADFTTAIIRNSDFEGAILCGTLMPWGKDDSGC